MGAQGQHRNDVPYVEELLSDVELPVGWTRSRGMNGWTVSGPCPTCLGDAYSDAPQYSDVKVRSGEAPDAGVEEALSDGGSVLASCHCDNSHGKEGASSCGRQWLMPVPGGE